MKNCIIPNNYESLLDVRETEIAIKKLKDFFETNLAKKLNITRVSAPLFVAPETGLNDNLSGTESAVSFHAPFVNNELEIVHSLAKWKRMALYKYNFEHFEGLYTDMNAIRRQEITDNTHSIYVDQWDWEKVINRESRTIEYLQKTVKEIYSTLLDTQDFINKEYPQIPKTLPNEITFISTKELESLYPEESFEERENIVAKQYGAVFIYQIGHDLKDGEPHGARAADYDDWNLNGDIIVWYETLNRAYEISSMGIRVDETSLKLQLKHKDLLHKLELEYHSLLAESKLPLTIGGGIGQSRLCMFFLKKAHIGEVQASIWDQHTIESCKKHKINLL